MADDRGQGRPEHLHAHILDEEHVQDHVQNGGHGDEQKGPLAVAHAPQDGADDVIAVDEDEAAHAGHKIVHGVVPGGGGGVEPGEQGGPKQEADQGDTSRHGQQEGEHGADGPLDVIGPLFPHGPGDDHLTGGTKAHGHEGQQVQQIAADGHGGHAGLADVVAHHHHVHHVVHRLQGVGHEQRQSEPKEQRRHRPPCQILHHGLLSFHPPFLSDQLFRCRSYRVSAAKRVLATRSPSVWGKQ